MMFMILGGKKSAQILCSLSSERFISGFPVVKADSNISTSFGAKCFE